MELKKKTTKHSEKMSLIDKERIKSRRKTVQNNYFRKSGGFQKQFSIRLPEDKDNIILITQKEEGCSPEGGVSEAYPYEEKNLELALSRLEDKNKIGLLNLPMLPRELI